MLFFFFSSRRRHTICALVTGVQTCALPIFRSPRWRAKYPGEADMDDIGAATVRRITWRLMPLLCLLYLVAYIDRQNVAYAKLQMVGDLRSEERRVGKESVSTCRSRWSPDH